MTDTMPEEKDERIKSLDDLELDFLHVEELLFDEMPAADEAQNFFLTHDLQSIIDEIRKWRKAHWSEGFKPDYCAAKEALKEHLRCLSQNKSTVDTEKAEDDKTIAALAEALEDIQSMVDETTTKTNLTGTIGVFAHEALRDNAPRIAQAQEEKI